MNHADARGKNIPGRGESKHKRPVMYVCRSQCSWSRVTTGQSGRQPGQRDRELVGPVGHCRALAGTPKVVEAAGGWSDLTV